MNSVPFVKSDQKTEDANVDICYPTHSLEGFMCVCVCVYMCMVHAFVLTPCLSGSSKALSGALCGLRSLPFHYPSFCLSDSYLIELAQKQSKYRYLRLRAKLYWCLGEVSPLSVCLCLHLCHDPFKRIHEQHIKGHLSQWCPPILSGLRGRWDSPSSSMNTHTLARFQTGVLTDKWYTYGVANRSKNWVQVLSFVSSLLFLPRHLHSLALHYLFLPIA